jgi:predicted kinase
VPGAIVVRSDEVRKRLCGVGPLDRLGPDGYKPAVSARVYTEAFGQAARIAATGHSVIVDAMFARAEDRTAVERVAHEAGVPFTGLWLDARPEIRLRRVEGRHADVSDADAAVARRQEADPVDSAAWHHIDAEGDLDPMVVEARRAVSGGR